MPFRIFSYQQSRFLSFLHTNLVVNIPELLFRQDYFQSLSQRRDQYAAGFIWQQNWQCNKSSLVKLMIPPLIFKWTTNFKLPTARSNILLKSHYIYVSLKIAYCNDIFAVWLMYTPFSFLCIIFCFITSNFLLGNYYYYKFI